MEIIAIVLAILLVVAAGVLLWFYIVKGIFLPAMVGIYWVRKENKSTYRKKGQFRPATDRDRLSFFLQHPALEGAGDLFLKAEKKQISLASNMPLRDFCALAGQPGQAPCVAESFNYLIRQKQQGKAVFLTDIYPAEAVKNDPDKRAVKGILFLGEPGKPLMIVIPGGGFNVVCTYVEGLPEAMELHRHGYSVFVLIYRVNRELHCKDDLSKGQEAARDVAPAVRYLLEHQALYGYTMSGYGMMGFSAGGLMTTAFSFADYKDCCHTYGLPRPAAIFPIYGLHWEITATEKDNGLALFSRVGRNDAFGFGKVEARLPSLKKILGAENMNIKLYDDLPHGFGPGFGTCVEGWLQEAIQFWQVHQS